MIGNNSHPFERKGVKSNYDRRHVYKVLAGQGNITMTGYLDKEQLLEVKTKNEKINDFGDIMGTAPKSRGINFQDQKADLSHHQGSLGYDSFV